MPIPVLNGAAREEIKGVIRDQMPHSDMGKRKIIEYVVDKLVNDQQLQELMNEVVRIKRSEQSCH